MSFGNRVLGFGAFPNRDTDDYEIEQSLMFEDADSSALHRTPGSAGNRRTWTWSGWVKKCASLGSSNTSDIFSLFSTDGSNHNMNLVFYQDDLFIQDYIYPTGTQYYLITNAKYRDYSAWYHIVLAVDTTQGTASNRVKLYVNGEQVTSFSTETYPSENYEGWVNSASMQHNIGNAYGHGANYGLDGYMAEVHLIDGTALAASDFGETDSDTGQWIPKEYTGGSYGTCGYYLKFVSGAIGTDSSGVGNNFTVSNLDNKDVKGDTPTNNFPVLNPIQRAAEVTMANVALSQGNLRFVNDNYNPTPGATAVATMGFNTADSTGYYWEVYVERVGREDLQWCGISPAEEPTGRTSATGGNDSWSFSWDSSGNVYRYYPSYDSSNLGTSSGEDATGCLFSLAVKNNKMWLRMNGTWYGDPAANTPSAPESGIPLCHNIPDMYALPVFVGHAGSFAGLSFGDTILVVNFGQDGTFNGNKTAQGNSDVNGHGNFYYAVPSGFVALCSKNLPTPTIKKPGDYFNPVIYTGNATARDITVGFQPDFVWTKSRNNSWAHLVQDSVRGATKELRTNLDIAENTEAQSITAFSSTGYSLGTLTDYNANTYTFVSWNWKSGGAPTADNSAGAGATPTAGSVKIDGSNLGSALAGSIAATRLSANTTSGFSIVKFEGTGSNATVAHGLGVAPDLIIVKSTTSTQSWLVYQSAAGVSGGSDPETDYLFLNSTAAITDDNSAWNDTAPTSTVFSVGTSWASNKSTETYVAYCFASVEGYSKVGTYVGNNNVEGTFVYTGFRPAFVMAKDVNATESWNLLDNKRNAYNPVTLPVWADLTSVEGAYGGSGAIDFLSNGFKLRATNGTINGSTNTWVYLAFAESPFKYANAR